MNPEDLLKFTEDLAGHLPWLWTLVLLTVRYAALLLILPGTGLGPAGVIIRLPAATVLAFASLHSDALAVVPLHWLSLIGQVVVEASFGTLLGIIPFFMITGIQMGTGIASTSMGLSASNLIDPTSGGQVSDISRIFGDCALVIFISIGGYISVIYAASGVGMNFIPGEPFAIGDGSAILMERVSALFLLGVMISAPVVVALLLTQFVMGLISRAVPTVNVFIISFPLTIGIGMILSSMVIPSLKGIVIHEVGEMQTTLSKVVALRDKPK